MRVFSIHFALFLVFLLGSSSTVIGQKNPTIQLHAHPNQLGGFDRMFTEIKTVKTPLIYRKTMVLNTVDFVSLSIRKNRKITLDSLSFLADNQPIRLKIRQQNDTLFSVELPKRTINYELKIAVKNEVKVLLKVAVYKELTKHVYLIPLTRFTQPLDSLQLALNRTFSAAGVSIKLHVQKYEQLIEDQQELLDNPSSEYDRYAIQMQTIRDAYFSKNGIANRSGFYLFLVPGFMNDTLEYYAVQNKSIGFLTVKETILTANSIEQAMAIGLGAGLKHVKNTPLKYVEWKHIRQQIYTFSMYDAYENVRSSSGRVAYYFWEKNIDGSIQLHNNDVLASLLRPFKKNYYSYHLNITVFWFKPLFYIKSYSVNFIHLLVTILIFSSAIYYRMKLHRFIKLRFRRSLIMRIFSRIAIFIVAIGTVLFAYILVNFGYRFFEVKEGIIHTFDHLNEQNVRSKISSNIHSSSNDVFQLHSEVITKEKEHWVLHRFKSVLYFTVQEDTFSGKQKLFFSGTSDSLLVPTLSVAKKAKSHYSVVSYKRNNRLIQQKIFNYEGIDLSAKVNLKDPISRVLLFVNGYRPTVFGADFEETFAAIQQKGLEFPNSENVLFDFDRFDYWQPWNNIVGLFQKRINPATILYADGHFSVSTSNYKNMVEFTSVSSRYPKRCSNPKKHHCYKTITTRSKFLGGTKKENTLDLLPLKANKKGFELRYQNGKTAGLNLLQRLNEIPNRSQNDTLFIVAHSMGYAYSLGIIDVVRGHINFGGFYIIAPENASSGKLNTNEWKEVWQYGSKLWGKAEAPCMQDGVAPQQLAQGLNFSHHVEFPVSSYRHRGFFNSHFIGYYTWIFDLQSKDKGFIGQH